MLIGVPLVLSELGGLGRGNFMEATFLVFAVIFAIGFFISVLRANIVKDRILRKIYTNNNELWKRLGMPIGWRWSPPGKIAHPFHRWWPGISYLWNEPAWLESAGDVALEFRQWQKAARCASFIFFPLAVLFGCLAALCDSMK